MKECIAELTYGHRSAKSVSLVIVGWGKFQAEVMHDDSELSTLTKAGLDPRIHFLLKLGGPRFSEGEKVWDLVEDGGWLLVVPSSFDSSV